MAYLSCEASITVEYCILADPQLQSIPGTFRNKLGNNPSLKKFGT